MVCSFHQPINKPDLLRIPTSLPEYRLSYQRAKERSDGPHRSCKGVVAELEQRLPISDLQHPSTLRPGLCRALLEDLPMVSQF